MFGDKIAHMISKNQCNPTVMFHLFLLHNHTLKYTKMSD